MRIIVNDTMSKKMYFNGIPFWGVGALVSEEIPFYIRTGNGQAQTVTIFKRDSSELVFTVESSTDMKNWSTVGEVSTAGIQVSVPESGQVFLRASTDSWSNIGFKDGSNIVIGGNIMSLLYGSAFTGRQTILPSTHTFNGLFSWWGSLIDASELILPSTTLTTRCYEWMFAACQNMTKAPNLPATNLADYCYDQMLDSCYHLEVAPELPATTLATGCYRYMFHYCGTLTKAPVLPAENLTTQCYDQLFLGCSNISEIKCNAITGINSNSLAYWVGGSMGDRSVAAEGTFYKNPDAEWPIGVANHGIPEGWTIKDYEE